MSKTILITGCSSGFGFTATAYLSDRGYKVIPTMRRRDDLKLFPNSILLDVTWSQEKIDQTVKSLGRIDVLVNNAGLGLLGRVKDLSEEQVKAQFDVNLFGPLKMIKSVDAKLIINISSILGLFSIPDYGLYSASKFALEALSSALRLEEAKKGTKVVVINPGAFRTKFYKNALTVSKENYDPQGYGLDPILVAKLIEKIIVTPSPKSNYIIGKEANLVKLLISLPPFIKNPLLQKYFS